MGRSGRDVRRKRKAITGIRNQEPRQWLHLRKEMTTGTSIRGRSRRQQLQLESTGNVNETFRDTLELEITKRIAGTSIRLRKMRVRTLWRAQPPSKRKRDSTQSRSHKCRSIDHSRNCCPHQSVKENDGDKPGPARTLSGSRLGRATLRRVQQEWLERNHHENRATGRKVKPIIEVTSTALRQEEMVVCL
jgi:hypothetical protein